ncbi:hypothetical protein ACFY8O_15720 [Streptomyces argenteolus]|uniref:Uncharacterized protein n=1 Tax=Streptomyces argenteolus TaxID=67274 RepID=A0ABW6X5L0_9ACTN
MRSSRAGSVRCSGSVGSRRIVVTAASCPFGRTHTVRTGGKTALRCCRTLSQQW